MNAALGHELYELAVLAGSSEPEDKLLPRVLDLLAEKIPYDLAAVLERENDELVVRCARGPLASPELLRHRMKLSAKPEVARVLEGREARVMDEAAHALGSDPYHAVLKLPDGHACMVVPLVAADQVVGAMTFDRAVCGVYDAGVVDLATIYGQLVGLSLGATRSLREENRRLSEVNRLLQETSPKGGIGASEDPKMKQVAALGYQVAQTAAPVLITGETGTGKELLARAIHNWSDRSRGPFVKLNCAALPEHLIESELFGHVRGAFSGASQDRPGRFLAADGGSLLLDEIGDMPLAAQAKLLRVLQEGAIDAVGSDKSIKVDVRVMAATHVNLPEAIREGRFRRDLYYRLNLFPIELPPLRDRPGDIAPISREFLARHAKDTGRGPWHLSEDSKRRLEAHSWPGNVRELVNLLERATILNHRGELQVAPDLESPIPPSEAMAADGRWPTLTELEAKHIRRTLDRTGGKLYGPGGAAELLAIHPSTLQSRIKKLGIRRHG